LSSGLEGAAVLSGGGGGGGAVAGLCGCHCDCFVCFVLVVCDSKWGWIGAMCVFCLCASVWTGDWLLWCFGLKMLWCDDVLNVVPWAANPLLLSSFNKPCGQGYKLTFRNMCN
jgi:hypothetical protein